MNISAALNSNEVELPRWLLPVLGIVVIAALIGIVFNTTSSNRDNTNSTSGQAINLETFDPEIGQVYVDGYSLTWAENGGCNVSISDRNQSLFTSGDTDPCSLPIIMSILDQFAKTGEEAAKIAEDLKNLLLQIATK